MDSKPKKDPWRVARELRGSPGLAWIRKVLDQYDWSQVEWINVRRMRSKRRFGFHGHCRYLKDRKTYRINCNVGVDYPFACETRKRPLYRNADGTWPEVSPGHKVGQHFKSTNSQGRAVEWKRLYATIKIADEDEALVYLVAHEAFHYLRRSRQIPGRNTEIDADAFANEMLTGYRSTPCALPRV